MMYKWDAQNILTRSISYDILGVLIMDMVYWYNKTKSMGRKNPFLHGFGIITHPILMMSKWKAQNILTRSITYDILGVLIMDWVNWYFNQ